MVKLWRKPLLNLLILFLFQAGAVAAILDHEFTGNMESTD